LPRFVVQEHYARSHHFDLRLERDGVLLSWSVPKGVPTDPKKNRLAVRVEDHALSHLHFEDDTPVEGVPGAVRKSTWDRGTYEAEVFEDDRVVAFFDGGKVKGRFAIFRAGGKNWLMHKMDTPAVTA
jgi:bifunctional non-homologous end joining protein LigD